MRLYPGNKPSASSQHAFIFYRPATKTSPEQIFYNEEVCSILSMSAASPDMEREIPPYISALCLKWKDFLEKNHEGMPSSGGSGKNKGMRHIAMLESHKRNYIVTGIALSENPADSQENKQYLFIIERASPESTNLSMVFRQYKLSGLEQEIVRLLLAGNGNKEIAWELGLSENTVKGYMKILMGKLGVNNRAGIIAALLLGNPVPRNKIHE